jgi:acetyltransferase-like isoleucine patch superfamily enzyme
MRKVRKIFSVIKRIFIQKSMYISTSFYMNMYLKHLKKLGMNFNGKPSFIHNDVYFDGKDYSKIHLGNNVTISREVLFLTHDYSIHTVHRNLSLENKVLVEQIDQQNSCLILESIYVDDNSFIGARATILPGTIIGKNVIIGSCAVVKGKIPDNSIVIGNPGKIIGRTDNWIDRKITLIKNYEYNKNIKNEE